VAAAVALQTGIQQAIVFREEPEPLDATPAPVAILSLPDAVRLALLHDPRIQQALAKVRIAEADADQVRLLPNPILNIDIRIPQQPGFNTAFEATLTGDLVSLLQKPGLIAAADKRLRISACDALTVVLDVIGEVQQSYASVQSTDAEVDTAQQRLDILQRLRAMAQERLTAGEGTRLDVLTLDAQLMQSTLDLADQRELAAEERLHLARLLGQPAAPANWQLSPIVAVPSSESLAPESDWIAAALRNRPELCGKAWELRALGDDLSAAAFSPFLGGDLGAHTERDPEWRTGPTLTIPLPIFDFGQASRARIHAQQVAARHDLLEQQREIVQDVRTSFAALQHACNALISVRDNLLPLQQQQLDQARKAYQAGETDLTTLLLAESDHQLALSKAIELREKAAVALYKLQRAAGGAAIASPLMLPATLPSTRPSAPPDARFSSPSTSPASRPATGNVP
jgi:outer membrane protein TolC